MLSSNDPRLRAARATAETIEALTRSKPLNPATRPLPPYNCPTGTCRTDKICEEAAVGDPIDPFGREHIERNACNRCPSTNPPRVISVSGTIVFSLFVLNMLNPTEANAHHILPLEQSDAVNAQHVDGMSKINDQVFRARLESYLSTEWVDDTGNPKLQGLISKVINDDCPRLEVCREMDVVILSIARLRIPDTIASEEFWEAMIAQRPNPNQRAGAFLTEMLVGMGQEDTIAFYRRVNGWWQFET